MASKNTEQKKEQRDIETMKYLEEVREVDKRHMKSFRPIIQHLEDGSIVPRMVVVDIKGDNAK